MSKKATLCDELVDISRTLHWKSAIRTLTFILTLGLRFDDIASSNMINLIAKGSIDLHPSLRGRFFWSVHNNAITLTRIHVGKLALC